MSTDAHVKVNLDARCTKCKAPGPVNETGLCLKCLTPRVVEEARKLRLKEGKPMPKDGFKEVEFDATLKRIQSTTKEDEAGRTHLVAGFALEAVDLDDDLMHRLITMQHRGRLRITVVAVQGELGL